MGDSNTVYVAIRLKLKDDMADDIADTVNELDMLVAHRNIADSEIIGYGPSVGDII